MAEHPFGHGGKFSESPPLSRLTSVNWGHPFLAAERFGDLHFSSDLISWTPVAHYDGPGVGQGAFGRGRYLLAPFTLSASLVVLTMIDWKLIPNPHGAQLTHGVAFGNDRFAVLSANTRRVAFGRVDPRDDEIGWSILVVPEEIDAIQGMEFTNGRFFVFGINITIREYTPVIGYDWTTQEMILGTPTEATVFKARIVSTLNGAAWSTVEDPCADVDDGTSGTITLENPSNPGEFVTLPLTIPDESAANTAVQCMARYGPEGRPAVIADQGFDVIHTARSPTGIGGWTVGTVEPINQIIQRLCHLGDRFIVGSGPVSDAVYRSVDGSSWSKVEGIEPPGNSKMTYGKGKIAVPFGGSVYITENGTSFSIVNTSMTDIREVVY